MKVFVVLIACLQSTFTPLDKTCTTMPMSEVFDNVSQCLLYVDYIKRDIESADPNMHITGFCTTKNLENI
jgi:hypothetical protein